MSNLNNMLNKKSFFTPFIALLVVIIVVIFLWQQRKVDSYIFNVDDNATDHSDWEVYTNDEFEFQISLPPKWSNVKISQKYKFLEVDLS